MPKGDEQSIDIDSSSDFAAVLPSFQLDAHKHTRGHVLCLSAGLEMMGASRLAAAGAIRCGAGIVTIAAPKPTLVAHASQSSCFILRGIDSPMAFEKLIESERFSGLILGPGLSPNETTRNYVLSALKCGKNIVLDAGALTAFQSNSHQLTTAIGASSGRVVMTPHEQEFARLFPNINHAQDKADRARIAARRSGAVVILKGNATAIAGPNGIVSSATNGPPWLATAGSGDFLAGIIGGLMAQGVSAYQAGCLGVWLHGDAADRIGPPLIATDLDEGLRQSLAALFEKQAANN